MRYDRAEIMKTAHRTYKYVAKKQGKTFGEVLKATWRLAKIHLSIAVAEAKEKAEKLAEKEYRKAHPVKVTKVSYQFEGDVYNANSRGYLGSHYCGD